MTVNQAPSEAIVLFDGHCVMCNAGIDLLLRADRCGVLRFGALQSPAGRRLAAHHGLKADDPDSFYVLEGDLVRDKADAALAIARRLGGPCWREIWCATRPTRRSPSPGAWAAPGTSRASSPCCPNACATPSTTGWRETASAGSVPATPAACRARKSALGS